jgi:uncharacterized membrane protein (DUF4010 family)
MQLPDSALDAGLRLAIAALVGLAVGIEREWSGRAPGERRRFAGLRTFLIFGLTGGIAGLLTLQGLVAAAAALIGGTAIFIAAAYVMAVRGSNDHPDGTTEAAALVVLGLGMLAGAGELALAAGSAAVVVFALGEKERLHWLVGRIDELEMRAGLRFLVMALVVLPLVPADPDPWLGGLTLRGLWFIVLLLSGLNFVGYIARRVVGTERGYGITGMLGGSFSSTLVAFQFSRLSRKEPEDGRALAVGVIGACTVLLVRVGVVATALSPVVAEATLPYLVAPALIGAVFVVRAFQQTRSKPAAGTETRSPLGFWSSLRMAIIFGIALVALARIREAWGNAGVLTSAVVIGVTDMDALTLAMTRMASETGGIALAAQGIAVGLIATSVFKAAIAAALGRGTFRRDVLLGLAAQALSVGGGLWLLR